jgi:hypothetical protein
VTTGTDTAVAGIVPEGTNSHTYEPAPSVAATIEDADVVFMNGLAQTGGGVAGLPSASFWTARAVTDFDGDGKADVLWTGTNGDAWVWLMDGVAKKSQGSLGVVPAGWSAAAVGDFDGDGKADIAWRFTDGSGWLWTVDGLAIASQGPFASPGGTWQLVRP